MSANVATELNYLWKVKAVGGAYMDPAGEVLKTNPSGEILVVTILTEDKNIGSMWQDGSVSL